MNQKGAGGKIIISDGRYEEQVTLQKSILAEAIKAGNMPIDLLHCVPPSCTIQEGERRHSALARVFLQNG